MSNTLILTLTNKEIIAAECVYNKKEKTYLVINPLEIYFRRLVHGGTMIGLYPWLMKEILLVNNTVIDESKIIAINHPTNKFIEFYDTMCEFYEKNNRQDLIEKQFDEIILSYKEGKGFEDKLDSLEDELEEEYIKPRSNKRIH